MRILLALAVAGTALAGCATNGGLPPTEVLRYHADQPIERGTIAVQQATNDSMPASLEFRAYADAVQGELQRIGYTPAVPGAPAQFVAVVDFNRTTQEGPPRRSPFTIGLGGGGYSGGGGYRGGGGGGLGGGVSFPVGSRRPREVLLSELAVTIKRNADRSPVWEGRAHTATDLRATDADTGAQARKLAYALFTGFPGQSGRTILVK